MSKEETEEDDIPKVLKAIDKLIKDVDNKYDELIYDRFMDYIGHIHGTKLIKSVLDHIRLYVDHEAFVMLNQARAFSISCKILSSFSPFSSGPMKFSENFDSIWNTLEMVVMNENASSIESLLKFLAQLFFRKTTQVWLCSKTVVPPVRPPKHPDYEIRDMLTLTTYYMNHCNNYRVQATAETIFKELILGVTRFTPQNLESHPIGLALKEAIDDMAKSANPAILRIFIKFMQTNMAMQEDVLQLFGLCELMETVFRTQIENDKCETFDLVCKAAAMMNSEEFFKEHILKMRSKKMLKHIILYIGHSRCLSHPNFEQFMLTYLVYPLLTKCTGDDAILLQQKILATREERDFVESNCDSKTVFLCLIQLECVVDGNKNNDGRTHIQRGFLPSRSQCLIGQSLTQYIAHSVGLQNIRNNHKNLMQCCTFLEYLLSVPLSFYDSSITLILSSNIQAILRDIVISEQTKPLILRLLSIMQRVHRRLSRESPDIAIEPLFSSLKLSKRFDDHDILNEVLACFVVNSYSTKALTPREEDLFVELLWTHIYPLVKDSDHREIMGNLAHLLVCLDSDIEIAILDKYNIKRHKDIPQLIGDLLIDRAGMLPTVEIIMDGLDPIVRSETNGSGLDSFYKRPKPIERDYVTFLDSPTLSSSVRKSFDHLTRGLCRTVRGEASDKHRTIAMRLIELIVIEIVTNCDDSELILRRFIDNGILLLLYDVCVHSSYSKSYFTVAQQRVEFIKKNVVKRFKSNAGLMIIDLLNVKNQSMSEKQTTTASDNASTASEKVSSSMHPEPEIVAEFYTVDTKFLRQLSTEDWKSSVPDTEKNRMSMVTDVLDYERICDKISDCY